MAFAVPFFHTFQADKIPKSRGYLSLIFNVHELTSLILFLPATVQLVH